MLTVLPGLIKTRFFYFKKMTISIYFIMTVFVGYVSSRLIEEDKTHFGYIVPLGFGVTGLLYFWDVLILAQYLVPLHRSWDVADELFKRDSVNLGNMIAGKLVKFERVRQRHPAHVLPLDGETDDAFRRPLPWRVECGVSGLEHADFSALSKK